MWEQAIPFFEKIFDAVSDKNRKWQDEEYNGVRIKPSDDKRKDEK